THGTATPLGDPIEVEALAAILGAPRADGSVCYLGSAKANVGHMEAASGVAGLIKATLVLQHREIPQQVHFTTLNSHIALDGTCLQVANRRIDWTDSEQPRVAGVSGFGVGGTNAHVIVEEAPAIPLNSPASKDETFLLPLSAQSPATLHAVAEKWIAFLARTPAPAHIICATAATRRSHYGHRLAVSGKSAAELAEQLRKITREQIGLGTAASSNAVDSARIAFVFGGQGSQWPQMGQQLFEREPIFRAALADIGARFEKLSGWSLLALISEPAASSRLQDTDVAQPAIFAIQVSLAALWNSWGVRAEAVIGHSVGEIAALHVAGMVTLDDAIRIVWHRGRIMQRATGNGAMAAVALSANDAKRLVAEIGPDLSLAAVNGPRSTVLAGTKAALSAALSQLDQQEVRHRALPVQYAFHSAQMAAFEDELVTAIGAVQTQPGQSAVYSTVTGMRIDHSQIDARYFGHNMRQTVLFDPAVKSMLDEGIDVIVELSPHPVVAGAVSERVGQEKLDTLVHASMRREHDERESMLRACGGVYAAGGTIRWNVVSPLNDSPIDLPSYPWQRERYWLRPFDRYRLEETATAAENEAPGAVTWQRGWLGARVRENAPDRVTFEVSWPHASLAWMDDHRINGRVVMPAAAMLEMLRAAAREVLGVQYPGLSDFIVTEPVVLGSEDNQHATWRIVVSTGSEGSRAELRISETGEKPHTNSEGKAWRVIASADINLTDAAPRPLGFGGEAAWQTDPSRLYEAFAELGVQFGTQFRTVQRWRSAIDQAEGALVAPEFAGAGFDIHPGVLDGLLQLCVIALTGADGQPPREIMLPVAVQSYRVLQPVSKCVTATVRVNRDDWSRSVSADAQLWSEEGLLVAEILGARFAPADQAALDRMTGGSVNNDLYTVRWRPVESLPSAVDNGAAGRWILLADEGALSNVIAEAITDAGGECVVVNSAGRVARASTLAPIATGAAHALSEQLSALLSATALEPRGVVHIWGAATTASTDRAEASWLTGESALVTLQTVARSACPDVPTWLVTNAAQPVIDAVLHPQQAALWGMCAVADVELANRGCRVVDVAGDDARRQGELLVRELVTGNNDWTRIALRDGQRYVPVLSRYRPARAHEM
ncbi:MAG: acyltransferase domain-containing protein, partial [Phycisphaerae bacterium]|nr:acyltransferase domain-containing protein [Gemmatimonadaceae bacterium]